MIRALRSALAAAAVALFAVPAFGQFVMVVDSSGTDRVLLLSAQDGSVVNSDFIGGANSVPITFGTPKEAIQVGNEIWISDQINDSIYRFTASMSPAFLGTITGQLDNIRGLGVVGDRVYVSNDGANNNATADSLGVYDFFGSRVDTISTNPPATSPFDAEAFNGDVLVSCFSTDGIYRYSTAGAFLGTFHIGGGLNNPEQIHVANSGPMGEQEVWAAGSSTPSGLYRYDALGNQLNYFPGAGTSGCFVLGDGQVLLVNTATVEKVDPSTGFVTPITTVVSGQYASAFTPASAVFPQGTATPAFGQGGSMISLSVNVIPAPDSTGIQVSADLTAFGGSASQAFADQGGNTFDFTLTIPMVTPGGVYQIPINASDAQMRSGQTQISLLVLNGYIEETETNSQKATANSAAIASGAGVFGSSRGASIASGADNSADYFLITTPVQPAGIYRHRMIITVDGPEGHVGSLRGLSQSGGVIQPGTDSQMQTSQVSSQPQRFNQWYGFAAGTQMYYRVAGNSSTTGTYFATLDTQPVTPTDLAGSLEPGTITISPGMTNSTTVDMLVFDENFQPIANFNTDAAPSLTRTFAAGTYYLAVSDVNTTDSRAAGTGSTILSNTVCDFAGVVANTSTSSVADLSMNFADGVSGNVSVALNKPALFDVAWVRFVVGGSAPCPGDYDGSGSVDLLDLLAFNGDWSGNLGQSVPMGTLGDYDGSGSVDLLDLLAFNGDWSNGLGSPCP